MRATRIALIAAGLAVMTLPAAGQTDARGAAAVAPQEQEAPARKQPKKNIYDESADAKEQIAAALARATKENRRVLIQWGANWCGWCHRLEAWMAREDVAKILAGDFIDVKIDIDRTIGGNDVMARYRKDQESGGIPWFVFLDAEGKAIVTSDGPDGNLGCPYTDQEIAAFGKILEQAAVTISAEQIDQLRGSLVKAREKKKLAD